MNNKFIDDNGKLFGIINIFDLLVITVLLSCIPFVCNYIKSYHVPKEITSIHNKRIGVYIVEAIITDETPSEVLDLVKAGDTQKDDNGGAWSRIISINGRKVILEYRRYIEDQEIFLGRNVFKPGSSLSFDTEKYHILITAVRIKQENQ